MKKKDIKTGYDLIMDECDRANKAHIKSMDNAAIELARNTFKNIDKDK